MAGDSATIKDLTDGESVNPVLGGKCLDRFSCEILSPQLVNLARAQATLALLWGSRLGLRAAW
jgi:hypothetical protein